jgi:hypothetical protein
MTVRVAGTIMNGGEKATVGGSSKVAEFIHWELQ